MPDDATQPRDEYTGIGGSYIRDPLTGKRTPAPAEPPAPEAAEPAAKDKK